MPVNKFPKDNDGQEVPAIPVTLSEETLDATGDNVPMAGEGGTELNEEEQAILADDPQADVAPISEPTTEDDSE